MTHRGKRLFGAAIVIAIAIAVVVAVWLALILGKNLHVVVPGAVYRSAQLTSDDLSELAAELQLASVLAVRAERPEKDWYLEETRAAEALGLELQYLNLDPDRMPSRQRLSELVAQIDRAPRPLLLHCRAGVERSGLASALVMLLEGASVEKARDQFSIRYGFHPWLSQSNLPRVIDRYAAWLETHSVEHSAEVFRRWAMTDYVAEFYAAGLEIVEFPQATRVGEVIQLSLRVTNRSPEPMRFRAEKAFGVHVGMRLESVDSDAFERASRAGLQDLTLAPGESTLFEFGIGSVPKPGVYRLTIDLVDESVVWFSDMGSTPIVSEFRAG
jgi:undecaprenyl-diphosphatase